MMTTGGSVKGIVEVKGDVKIFFEARFMEELEIRPPLD